MTHLDELNHNLSPSDLGYLGRVQAQATQHDQDDFHHIATDHQELYVLVVSKRSENRKTQQSN